MLVAYYSKRTFNENHKQSIPFFELVNDSIWIFEYYFDPYHQTDATVIICQHTLPCCQGRCPLDSYSF